MTDQPIQLALVFGGASSEHSISCLTAAGVARAIDRDRYQVTGIGITRQGDWVRIGLDELTSYQVVEGRLPEVASDRPQAVLLAGGELATREGSQLVDPVNLDVVFALLHGPFGEDGTIQGMFEMLGVRYVGSGVTASAIGMDKDLMKRAMFAAGLPVGPWEAITPADWRDDRDAALGRVARLRYPLYVKPARGGSSLGISRVGEASALVAAIEAAQVFDPKVVVEQGFTNCREIELAVLENPDGPPRVSLPGEIVMHTADAFYDFDAKYLPEAQVTLQVPAELDAVHVRQAQELAAATFASMSAEGLARVDLFLDPAGKYWVNELNTMPGFTSHSMFPMMWAASGVSYPELIDDLVSLALRRGLGLR